MIVQRLNKKTPLKGFSRLSEVHIMYGLFFLKVYPTARQSVGTLGQNVGQNQFRKYSSFIVRMIASLSDDVVSKNTYFIIIIHYSITYLISSLCRFVGPIVSNLMLASNKKSLWMALTFCVNRQMMVMSAKAGSHSS